MVVVTVTIGNAVGNRILQLCQDKNITLNRLGTICGITQSTLNNIVSGGSRNPTIATVKKVCDGLDISLAKFFDAEIFYSLEQEIK